MDATSKQNTLPIDPLTILAIDAVSFIVKNVIHERWAWVIIAVILAIFHIFVLGPGVEF